MMTLSFLDLGIASLLILALSFLNFWLKLGQVKSILIASLRSVVQLLLVGYVLKFVFLNISPVWTFAILLFMFLVASREVMSRPKLTFGGLWGYSVGALSLFVSSFTINLFSLIVLLQVDPWYHPQYAIPMMGMLLGNTMTGIALALEKLTEAAWQEKDVIEARLMLGQTPKEAMSEIAKSSIRSALIPIINTMSIVGLVSLPGMMTGQILAGADPAEAVKYQILILFMIAAGVGFGAIGAIKLALHRLFDERHRLRLDRLTTKKS